MIARDLVPHALLVERFQSALDLFATDARADTAPRIIENLNELERDVLGVDETEFDLPDWI
jgi:hypothetical protein